MTFTLPKVPWTFAKDIPKWHLIEETARNLFSIYNFTEIRTPIFENTNVFARGMGVSLKFLIKKCTPFKMLEIEV